MTVGVSLAAMAEDLISFEQGLRDMGAPRKQVLRSRVAIAAVQELLYCVKPDCPECKAYWKRVLKQGRKEVRKTLSKSK